MQAKQLNARIEKMIAHLSCEIRAEDQQWGWTEESRIATLTFFQQLRADVMAGKDVAKIPHYVSIARGLDHWGIQGGSLLQEAAVISKLVSELVVP